MTITPEDLETAKKNNPSADVRVETVDGVETIVVSGGVSMSSFGGIGGNRRAKDFEAAAVRATEDCIAEGLIGDSEAILARKAAYRQLVKEGKPLPERSEEKKA